MYWSSSTVDATCTGDLYYSTVCTGKFQPATGTKSSSYLNSSSSYKDNITNYVNERSRNLWGPPDRCTVHISSSHRSSLASNLNNSNGYRNRIELSWEGESIQAWVRIFYIYIFKDLTFTQKVLQRGWKRLTKTKLILKIALREAVLSVLYV
jgi:hypothetical protein